MSGIENELFNYGHCNRFNKGQGTLFLLLYHCSLSTHRLFIIVASLLTDSLSL